MPPVIRFSVLASSSAGNAALVECGDTMVLVDAGISARRIQNCLKQRGMTFGDLTAILITHEHIDHCRAVTQISQKSPLPVYCTRYTGIELREKAPEAAFLFFEPGQSFSLGALRVTPFSVSHDAVDPVGFRFDCGEVGLGWLTDTGYIPRHIPPFLSGLRALYLESNYNPALLENDPRRPRSLKQRIASAQGHLSNEQACELVASLDTSHLESLVLAHLSRDCNTPDLALGAMRQTLDHLRRDTALFCAAPDEPLPTLEVAPSPSSES